MLLRSMYISLSVSPLDVNYGILLQNVCLRWFLHWNLPVFHPSQTRHQLGTTGYTCSNYLPQCATKFPFVIKFNRIAIFFNFKCLKALVFSDKCSILTLIYRTLILDIENGDIFFKSSHLFSHLISNPTFLLYETHVFSWTSTFLF